MPQSPFADAPGQRFSMPTERPVTPVGCRRRFAGGITGFAFFLVGGVLALLIRTQLAVPENQFLDHAAYNRRRARGEEDAVAREHHTFLALTTLFLCGLALLGTLWGGINLVAFVPCQP